MKYKVIKQFGPLNIGDILTKEDNMYKFSNEKSADDFYYSQVHVEISEELVKEYEKSNLVEAVKELNKEPVCTKDANEEKLERLAKLIDQLKYIYAKRKNNIERKFNDGKIQPCVKVEHDTVYFNMMKLLNKIDAIIKD